MILGDGNLVLLKKSVLEIFYWKNVQGKFNVYTIER